MDIQKLIYEFNLAPFVVEVAVAFICISVIITLITYLFILKRRFDSYRYDRRRRRIEPTIDEVIIGPMLLGEFDENNSNIHKAGVNVERLKHPPFHSRLNRQILIDHLNRYLKNMRGINGQLIKQIYLLLELDKDSMRKLRSKNWSAKVRGLQELTNMEVRIPDVNILPLTNSENRELRITARSAYLKLNKNEAFKFFDVVTEPMLEWDQMELFRIITSSEGITIPNFAKWIAYSPNKTVVEFCIKLAVHYNQIDAADAIMELLDSTDHDLRAQAIHAIGKLKVEDAEPVLIKLYYSQPLSCQIEVLKAVGNIDSGNQVDFLKIELLYANDFDIRKNAARALTKSDFFDEEMIDELKETADAESQLILNYCLNPLI